jgi:hypothetical protein
MPKKINDPVKPGKKRANVKREAFKPLSAKEIAESAKVIKEVGSGKVPGIVITLSKYTKAGETGLKGRVFCNGVETTERMQALFSAMSVPKEILLLALTVGMID